MKPVFTTDHLEGYCEYIRAARRQAQAELENALLKEMIVDLIEAGGNAVHAMFVAGGEPKWRHPSERERLMQLSDALHDAFSKLSKVRP